MKKSHKEAKSSESINNSFIQSKQKKEKSKKHSKQHPDSKKVNQEKKESIPIVEESKESKILNKSEPIQQEITPSAYFDQVAQQLNKLQITGNLYFNVENSNLVNSRLCQLTFKLAQRIIMKSSFIQESITLARELKLTPQQYHHLNYTNKVSFINKLFKTSPRKYEKFIVLAEQEIQRVNRMYLTSMKAFTLVEQIEADLMKNNVEMVINQKWLQSQ